MAQHNQIGRIQPNLDYNSSPFKHNHANENHEQRRPFKLNFQNSPKLPEGSGNPFQGKKLQNRDIPSNFFRKDFSEPFQPKKIEVEKNFVRINYLKDKHQEAAEAVAQSNAAIIKQQNITSTKSTGNKNIKQMFSVVTPRKQQQDQNNVLTSVKNSQKDIHSINYVKKEEAQIINNVIPKNQQQPKIALEKKETSSYLQINRYIAQNLTQESIGKKNEVPLILKPKSPNKSKIETAPKKKKISSIFEGQVKLAAEMTNSPIIKSIKNGNIVKRIECKSPNSVSRDSMNKDSTKAHNNEDLIRLEDMELNSQIKIQKQQQQNTSLSKEALSQIKNQLQNDSKSNNINESLQKKEIINNLQSNHEETKNVQQEDKSKEIMIPKNVNEKINNILNKNKKSKDRSNRHQSKGGCILPDNSSNGSCFSINSNKSVNSPLSSVRYRGSGCRSSVNGIDMSLEWNHKNSGMSNSGLNKTVEIMKNKFKAIMERKEEKRRIKEIQSAEKSLRDEIYGVFSQQSRYIKQKKKQEEQNALDLLTRKGSAYGDPLQIQRVNDLVKNSFEAFLAKKKEEEKQSLKLKEEEQKRKMDILERFGNEIRVVNLEKQMDIDEKRNSRRESRERSQLPWGIDQRKFEAKSQEKKQERSAKKERIDMKKIFSENVLANKAVLAKIKQKEQEEEEQRNKNQVKQLKQEHIQEGEKKQQLRRQLSTEEMSLIAEQRLKKIVEEKKQKLKEINLMKDNKKQQLELLEKKRLKSIQKCKLVPFLPTEEMIEGAFKIEEIDNKIYYDNVSRQETYSSQSKERSIKPKRQTSSKSIGSFKAKSQVQIERSNSSKHIPHNIGKKKESHKNPNQPTTSDRKCQSSYLAARNSSNKQRDQLNTEKKQRINNSFNQNIAKKNEIQEHNTDEQLQQLTNQYKLSQQQKTIAQKSINKNNNSQSNSRMNLSNLTHQSIKQEEENIMNYSSKQENDNMNFWQQNQEQKMEQSEDQQEIMRDDNDDADNDNDDHSFHDREESHRDDNQSQNDNQQNQEHELPLEMQQYEGEEYEALEDSQEFY